MPGRRHRGRSVRRLVRRARAGGARPPRRRGAKRMVAIVSADPRRRSGWPRKSRGSRRSCASRCCPTGRRCPTITSRRTRTSCPSGWPRCIARRAANATCWSSPRRRRCTGCAPPSYLAAFTFFLTQGEHARRRRAARAAGARRLHARDAGGVAGRVQRPRRADRPVPDGHRRCPTASTCSTTRSRRIKTFDVDTQRTLYPVPRRAPAAGARVSARRRRPHALPQPLSRSVRRRPVEVRAVQGHQQRHRARRHRVLPAAVLRSDRHARRLPAADRRSSRCTATSRGAVERFWQDTESRYRLLRGDKARPLLPPTELFLPRRRVQRRAQVVRAASSCAHDRRRAHAARCPPVQVDRRADDPLTALKRFLAATPARAW